MQKVILLKKELTYGTDAAPTPAANAVLTRNFQRPDPLLVDTLDRKLDLPARGRTRSASTNRRTASSFEVEIAGSGAAGTAAPWMEILEGGGMAPPSLTAATKAEQRFAAEGSPLSSLTGHDWLADQRVRSLGCRHTFGLDFTVGAYPFIKVDMQGLLPSPAVDGVAPAGAPDFARWQQPFEVNTVNTLVTLDGASPQLRSFTLDVNADVAVANFVGATAVDRGNHAITGRLIIVAPGIGARNYYNRLDAGDELPLQIVHGVGAGKIVQADASYLQITKITRSEERERVLLDIAFGVNIRAGQDDLLLTAK